MSQPSPNSRKVPPFLRGCLPSEIIEQAVLAECRLSESVDTEPLLEFSRSDEDRVVDIVRRELKSQTTDERVLKLSKAILTSLFKQLWTRRAQWKDGLTTQSE